MQWSVEIKKQAVKRITRLPKTVRYSLFVLIKEIEEAGPVRGNWPNYSKLGKNVHHCHLKKGKPTYVAMWEVKDKSIHLVEVTYAGSHEKAPY